MAYALVDSSEVHLQSIKKGSRVHKSDTTEVPTVGSAPKATPGADPSPLMPRAMIAWGELDEVTGTRKCGRGK